MTKTWTIADIYEPEYAWLPAIVDAELTDTMKCAFLPAFLEEFKNETEWVYATAAPSADFTRFAWGREACPNCEGVAAAKMLFRTVRGRNTGIFASVLYTCPCARIRALHKAHHSLPLILRSACLNTMTPTDEVSVSKQRQQKVIDSLKRGDNNLLYGAAHSGKSYLAAGAYIDAVTAWLDSGRSASTSCPAVFIDANTLLDQCMRWNQRSSDEEGKIATLPTVTPSMARAASLAGLTPTLVLDDIHRIKLGDSRVSTLVSILKAFTDEGGRIILTSRLSRDELEKKWEKDAPELFAWVKDKLKKLLVGDKAVA